MSEFDPGKVTMEPRPGTCGFVAVYYDGSFVGGGKKARDSDDYICAVAREQKGKHLEECGRGDTLERAAQTVASHWRTLKLGS